MLILFWVSFYSWFNIFGDMEEFEQMFTSKQVDKDWRLNKVGRRHMVASCSALIKVLPETSDIYTSHVTWNGYESMIRILKKYSLEVHQTAAEDSALIPGHSMSFSSYPGLLYSGDDFTVISSGLASMETTIGNNSKCLNDYENYADLKKLFRFQMKSYSSTSSLLVKS